jgi:alpha-1,3-rhamnosyl/mannosyltransferase
VGGDGGGDAGRLPRGSRTERRHHGAAAVTTPVGTEVAGLKVGVNLLWCLPGAVGGSEEYLVRQLTGLTSADPDVRLRLCVLPGFAAAHPDLARGHELVVASLDARRRSRRVLTEATWLRSRMTGMQVVHHGGGTVPPRSPRPIVLTIHDLQYRTFPQYLTPLKRRYLGVVMPRSVRRAAIVTVPSQYVRGTVIDAFGINPEQVAVVPHGVDRPAAWTDEATLRQRHHLGARRLLVYPAVTHPHKNHRFLLELMAGPWGDPDVLLVLLGAPGAADEEVSATIQRLDLGARVIRPGRVSEADRDGFIAAASALVFPSEYEGFGAPVLEAMVLGTPVLCSDRAALPEVAGDAAVVRPLTVEAWVDGMAEVVQRRDELITAGTRRAAWFTAASSGARLAEAYREAYRMASAA